MSNTTMTYGAYSFSPVPLVTMSKEIIRSADSTPLQELTKVTLTGTLVASPNLGGASGLDSIDIKIAELRDAFKTDCSLLTIMCDDILILKAFPRIVGLSIDSSSDNWVFTAPFTIELEYEIEAIDETTTFTENIRSANEQWELEFVEENPQFEETVSPGGVDHLPYLLRMNHSLDAQGIRTCISGTPANEGWKEARDWVNQRIGYNDICTSNGASGVINTPTGLGQFNHMRTISMDEINGTFAVTESWLLMNTGSTGLAGNATEDFTATLRSTLQEPLASISIEGNIQGLETRDYGSVPGDFTITEGKYTAASGYWTNVQAKLYGRAASIIGTLPRPLVINPATTSVAHNKSKGTISYQYLYDNRPCILLNAGPLSGLILSEIITMNVKTPTDVFAIIPVLGRRAGPILQEISTVTEGAQEISIEVVMQPPNDCTVLGQATSGNLLNDQVEQQILCALEDNITNNWDQVFKHVDNKSWVPNQGRYTRQIGWTYQACAQNVSTSISGCP